MVRIRVLTTALAALVSVAVLLFALGTDAIQRCNLEDSETHAMRVAKAQEMMRTAKARANARRNSKNAKNAAPLYELRVFFHVLMNNDGSEGHVPLDSIQANLDSANRVHSGQANSRGQGVDSRIRLFLAGVTYTNNSKWFYNCQDYTTASEIKFATAISAATTVNIWTCHSPNLLGWVHYLPYELAQHSVWNGVNINYQSLPPSKSDPKYRNHQDYADGDTLTHELGHFLGLLHTFGDGVDGCARGDNVDDTPPEKTAASGKACLMNPPRKTCPGTPGFDPVWNIMDYADDSCAEEFTKGQIEVMRYSIQQYKTNLIAYEPLRCVADGERGTARKMTVCKSQCFTDRVAPDGRPAPSTGWCRTDAVGNWGQCCCNGNCMASPPVIVPPATLTCGRRQAREELLRSVNGGCVIANIGGGPKAQLQMGSCGITEFGRWGFNWDGTIVSIGTGWCLSLLNYQKTDTNLEGRRVGLEPCVVLKPSQRWNVLPTGSNPAARTGTVLSLQVNSQYCLDASDGTFVMKDCSAIATTKAAPRWQRIGKIACERLRKRVLCMAASTTYGCACRWYKNRCIS